MAAPGWRSRVIVVADEPELLATYLPPGAQFAFPAGDHGLGPHPWHGPRRVARARRPDAAAARRALCRLAFLERRGAGVRGLVRQPAGAVPPHADRLRHLRPRARRLDPRGGGWSFKDDDLLDVRVQEGRFTAAEAAEIRALGAEIGAMLDRGAQWWDPSWSRWTPDSDLERCRHRRRVGRDRPTRLRRDSGGAHAGPSSGPRYANATAASVRARIMAAVALTTGVTPNRSDEKM